MYYTYILYKEGRCNKLYDIIICFAVLLFLTIFTNIYLYYIIIYNKIYAECICRKKMSS